MDSNQTDPTDRPQCAHLRVIYQAEGLRQGWWMCDECGTRFAPVGFEPPPMKVVADTAARKLADELKAAVKPSVRPSVQKFAQAMEERLRRNDYKVGWRFTSQRWLLMRLKQEVLELELELDKAKLKSECAVIPEAADVANFAMMIADCEDVFYGTLEPQRALDP